MMTQTQRQLHLLIQMDLLLAQMITIMKNLIPMLLGVGKQMAQQQQRMTPHQQV